MPRTKKATTTKKKASQPDNLSVVKSTAEELLSALGLEAQVAVSQADAGVVNVSVETPESGLLIGYHGETLSSFQLILGLIVYKKLGQWIKVVVEVGDYRAQRAQQLTAMANSYAAQVVATREPLTLPYLPPSERRIIHLALQGRTDVTTQSEGEGDQRRVVIKPANR